MAALFGALQEVIRQDRGVYSGRVARSYGGQSYAQIRGQILRIDSGQAAQGGRVMTAVTPEGVLLISSQAGAYGASEPEEVLIDL